MSKQLKSGFILSYTAIFIQSLISILYTPVMLRFLGTDNYGLLQLAISSIANLGILSFGFGSSYLRFYSKYKSEKNTDAIASLNGMFAVIFAVISVLALAVGGIITFNTHAIFSRSLSEGEVGTLKILLGIMTVNLALTFPCNIFDSYITSQERFTFQKSLVIATSLLNPILTLPQLLSGKDSVAVAVCMVVITAIRLGVSMGFCIKRLCMKFRFKFDKDVFRQLCMFSFFVFLNMVSDQINWNVDKTILGIIKGSENVTNYALGSQFNGYFLTFSYALSSLFSPRAYSLVASGVCDKKLTRFFALFGRIQFSVMAYIYIIFVTFGKMFIRIWSGIDNDIPYITALLLISPILITSVQSIGIEIQRAKDMHRFRSVVYVLIAIGNIALSIPLCTSYGEIGCSIGTCVCLVIGNIFIMNIYYHKRVGLDIFFFWKEIFKFVPALILPVITSVLIYKFVGESITSIFIGITIFTVVYWASMYFIGFTEHEKKYIQKR